MANKNTNMILAVAVIAVCAIAIIGVGYAYTATTENTGNTSTVKYITLNQGDDEDYYKETFDASITYNTVNTGPDTTTYELNDEISIGDTGATGVLLGSTTISVVRSSTDNTDTFNFSVKKTAGTMTAESTGKFYIGISTGTTETIREYAVASSNYYDNTTAGHAAITTDTSAVDITGSPTITVKLYYAPNLAANTEPDVLNPLNGVTFVFTATAPATA